MHTIHIARDFSDAPGFRYIDEGPDSGEEFRQKFLEPLFENRKDDFPVTVILDGVAGFATSFLEEAFGGLARKYGIEKVQSRLIFESQEDPYLVQEIETYIKESTTRPTLR